MTAALCCAPPATPGQVPPSLGLPYVFVTCPVSYYSIGHAGCRFRPIQMHFCSMGTATGTAGSAAARGGHRVAARASHHRSHCTSAFPVGFGSPPLMVYLFPPVPPLAGKRPHP